ncbi:MAG: prepilin peptidase [Candidatus Diapherotrites archaeon]
MLEMIRYFVVFAGTAISAYTDLRTGLILDKVTYPMIALGIVFSIADVFFLNSFTQLVVPLLVFAFSFLLYYLGKLGGGDVKIFTAMALLLPSFQGQPFVLNVLLVAALSSISILSVYFLFRYFSLKKRERVERKEKARAILLGIAIMLYFAVFVQLGFMGFLQALLLGVPLFLGVFAMAFQSGIYREFFLKYVSPKELEEDEIIAKEFLEPAVLAEAGLSIKGVLDLKAAEKLARAGVKKIPVYRSLPPFAPFLLFGVIVSYFVPDLFSLVFFP